MKRDAFTMPLGFKHELTVDNFAGGGGASEAIFQALGRHPDIAINHDGEALLMHASNHPSTTHYKEDVYLVHPGFVTKQQPIGLAWFSPTCTHFSNAKGGNILDQTTRGLSWVTLKWAALQVPRIIFLENVPEYLTWGPLDKAGRPIKKHKGRTFKAFVMAMTTGIPVNHPDLKEIHETLGADFPIERLHKGLGYKVEWKIMRACDWGSPTIRRRLYMVMRIDGRPIVWPAPTHGDPNSDAVKSGKLKPWRTAADCIDFTIPCPSIFDRPAAGKKPLKPNSLRRVGKGLRKYVLDNAMPFIIDTAHSEESPSGVKRWGSGVRDLYSPLQAVLAGGSSAAIVVPTLLPLTHQGSDRTNGADQPFPTITCANRGEIALAVTSLARIPSDTAAPASVLAPFVSTYYGAKSSTEVRGAGLTDPVHTVTTENRHAVVAASLVQYYSGGNQTLPMDGQVPAVVTKDRIGIQCAHLVKATEEQTAFHIQRDMGQSVGHAADRPTGAVTAGGGGKLAIVSSNLIKLHGTSNAAGTSDPLGAVCAGGLHHAEVRTSFAPAPALDAASLKRQQIREFLWEYCPGMEGVEKPELVMINGELYEIVDIGLRMLVPRELANAQGFRKDYILDPEYTYVTKTGKVVTKRLSKTSQVRMIGNSVSPPPACAIIQANYATEDAMLKVA